MKKLSMQQLHDNKDKWEEAVIVFTPDSFEKDFSEEERSYKISRNNKYFMPMMNGNSLFGDCLDGKDNGVRLDIYMSLLPEEGRRWKVDYCYITKKPMLKCPTCGTEHERLLALSRRDNKTMICDDCGTREAFEDMGDFFK